jgi:hypothetical protein
MLTGEQVQAAIYIVVGIIVIEGIWLAYLTYMMWKRHTQKTEEPATGEEEPKPAEQKK